MLAIAHCECIIDQGDHLQVEKARYYKSLVKQAKEHDEHLDKSPKVEKGSVEQALAEKIELARWQKEYLRSKKNAKLTSVHCLFLYRV